MVRGMEPLATMISSKPRRVFTSVTSVFRRTSMPSLATSLRYQRMSSLSFSLKLIADAVRNRPPSSPVFSKMTGVWPRCLSTSAHSMPPMPPPMMATFFGWRVGTILYLLCCMVVGFRAQRARCRESSMLWRFAVPLNFDMLKQPLWQRMQGLISSSWPLRILWTHSWSTRFWRAMATASRRPAAISSAAFTGSMRPAQTTGRLVNCLMCSTYSRLQLSGMYCGGCAQYQAS